MTESSNLAWTFDTVAETYEKMRPGYPAALYGDIFAARPLSPASVAVEVGIGGGQATLPVLQTGCHVTAIEYGGNFTALCREKFIAYPNFTCINSRFEDALWEKGTCDLVYSASAFHWIDEAAGYAKVFDMLKSGGVFARFANHPYKDRGRPGLAEAIESLYARFMPGSPEPAPYSEEQAKNRAQIAEKYGFADCTYHLYRRTRTFTAGEYTCLLSTYSDHAVLPEKDAFFAEIEETINSFGGEITIYDTLDLQLARKP